MSELEELLEENRALRKALESVLDCLLRALIDLQTNTPRRTTITTIEGGLKMVRAALASTRSNAK